jgi:hypothetical protein
MITNGKTESRLNHVTVPRHSPSQPRWGAVHGPVDPQAKGLLRWRRVVGRMTQPSPRSLSARFGCSRQDDFC